MGQRASQAKDGAILLPMGPTYPAEKTSPHSVASMYSKVPVESQSIYDTWAKNVQALAASESVILLPLTHSFKARGFCSTSG